MALEALGMVETRGLVAAIEAAEEEHSPIIVQFGVGQMAKMAHPTEMVPMIKAMEFSNMNLVRKINSAFIVTLPVFKQALAQAIMLKRQKIQAEAMSELDKKTNEMLIKNARNTVEQSKMTAQLASGSSIKIETLETTWRTIVTGIQETKAIQEEASRKRVEDQARLNQIKTEFNEMFHTNVK